MDLLTLGAFPAPVYMSAVATVTMNRAMGKTAKAVGMRFPFGVMKVF